MEGGLHPLPALCDGLIRQADDLHADLARRDHDLNLDRHTLYALKCHRIDARNHESPHMRTFENSHKASSCPSLQPCTDANAKQEQEVNNSTYTGQKKCGRLQAIKRRWSRSRPRRVLSARFR